MLYVNYICHVEVSSMNYIQKSKYVCWKKLETQNTKFI